MFKILNKIKFNQQGISLIEIMLVVIIFAVLLSSIIGLTSEKTPREDLEAKTRAVVDIISRAHNYAMTGYYGDHWGVAIFNNYPDCVESGTSDCVILFKGKSYGARDSSYDEILKLDSGGAHVDAYSEFYFQRSSGWLSSTTTDPLPDQAIIILNNFNSQKFVTTTQSGLVYFGD